MGTGFSRPGQLTRTKVATGHDGEVASTPGWYPDPWRIDGLRWWDGYQWTPYLSFPAPNFPSADLGPAHSTEERLWKWARLALCCFAALIAIEATAFVIAGDGFRQLLHQATVNSQDHLNTAPPISTFILVFGAFAVVWLLSILIIPSYIVLLIWQYNAAKVAKGIGYPGELSPGFGVACWFIPFINLWFPYLALRDCLPPGHPARPTVLRAWLTYLLTVVPLYLAASLGVISWVAALIPLLVCIAMAVAAMVLWSRCVTAIRDDHRQQLANVPGPGAQWPPHP
jgi:Protein of unknown function (DUF2510)